MKRSSFLLWLTAKNHRLNSLLPILVAYVILPAIGSVSNMEANQATKMICYAYQFLLPLTATLWGMTYLQVWIDNPGEEAMRSCCLSRTLVIDLFVLTISYMTVVLPAFSVITFTYGLSFIEHYRLIIEVFTMVGLLYAVATGSHSSTIGGVLCICYLIFSTLFARDSAVEAFCIIKPILIGDICDLGKVYTPFAIFAVIAWVLGFLFDRASRQRTF